MDISIIIPTYNRNSILYKHLAIAYVELKGMAYEIIIVNDSKTNKIELLPEWSSNISVINNPKQGVASARNLGASLARSENLIFMDDDMALKQNAVQKAIGFLNTNKDACLNVNWAYPDKLNAKLETYQFGRYLEHFGFTTLKGWQDEGFEWKDDQVIKANGVTSQFLAMTKTSFDKSGGYNENFPFAGFEDHDFGIRLQQKGITAYLDTGTMIWHNEEDRVQLEGWMQRKYRGGQTRKIAVQMGHKDLEINYNNLKGKLYFIISQVEFIFTWGLKLIPNIKMFDPLYFRIVNVLLGTNSYKGYTK